MRAPIRYLLTALALVGLIVASRFDVASEKRRQRRAVERASVDVGRYVDFGVEMRVVRMDLAAGEELLPGLPPLRVLDTLHFGGVVDTAAEVPDFVGPSISPAIWYCSEKAAPIICHGDELPDRLLVYGSEGAGKTRVLVQWLALRALEATGSGHRIGLTSPTNARALELREAIEELWPAEWYTYADARKLFSLRNGCKVQLLSTYKQSKKAGSRVQTFNWRAAASDELQDSLDTDADIEMRGRKAPAGRYKRLCTVTSKDAPEWRDWRDRALAAVSSVTKEPLWRRETLLGPQSPFVWPRFWEEKRGTMSAREWRRRIGAEDVPTENRVYYGFDRERHVVPIPESARSIADELLSAYRPFAGPGYKRASFAMVAGHDPGEIVNVTTMAVPYLWRRSICWFVVDRFITERTTAEQHAQRFARHLREKHSLNYDLGRDTGAIGGRCLVFCDPHGRGESKTDYATVYGAFVAAGVDVFSAAGDEQVIQARARRDMVNALFDPDEGPARLYVERQPSGDSVAPELVGALERLELIGSKAEANRKNTSDPTHHPVSLGYALWPFEAPAVAAMHRSRVLRTIERAA